MNMPRGSSHSLSSRNAFSKALPYLLKFNIFSELIPVCWWYACSTEIKTLPNLDQCHLFSANVFNHTPDWPAIGTMLWIKQKSNPSLSCRSLLSKSHEWFYHSRRNNQNPYGKTWSFISGMRKHKETEWIERKYWKWKRNYKLCGLQIFPRTWLVILSCPKSQAKILERGSKGCT